MPFAPYPSRLGRGRNRVPATVPALAYHKVSGIPPGARHQSDYVTPGQFAAQVRYLRAMGYRSISYVEYLAARRGEGVLPARPILISFDDGYRSILDFALPLLERHGFRVTVFAVSGMLGRTNEWDAADLQDELFSCDELRGLIARGHEIQSHTRTHRDLTRLPDRCAFGELRESREELERLTGAPVSVVAYPWGATDYRVQHLALDAGYEAGAILRRRVNRRTTSPLELRRIAVSAATTLPRFAWDLAGLRLRGE